MLGEDGGSGWRWRDVSPDGGTAEASGSHGSDFGDDVRFLVGNLRGGVGVLGMLELEGGGKPGSGASPRPTAPHDDLELLI